MIYQKVSSYAGKCLKSEEFSPNLVALKAWYCSLLSPDAQPGFRDLRKLPVEDLNSRKSCNFSKQRLYYITSVSK